MEFAAGFWSSSCSVVADVPDNGTSLTAEGEKNLKSEEHDDGASRKFAAMPAMEEDLSRHDKGAIPRGNKEDMEKPPMHCQRFQTIKQCATELVGGPITAECEDKSAGSSERENTGPFCNVILEFPDF